jgi:hypothetical protein
MLIAFFLYSFSKEWGRPGITCAECSGEGGLSSQGDRHNQSLPHLPEQRLPQGGQVLQKDFFCDFCASHINHRVWGPKQCSSLKKPIPRKSLDHHLQWILFPPTCWGRNPESRYASKYFTTELSLPALHWVLFIDFFWWYWGLNLGPHVC